MGINNKKIAIIGSGIAGLSAVHMLEKNNHITLFEKNKKIGGHTNTHTISSGIDEGLNIDTGFIVMNHQNYPLLSKLFTDLNVELHDSNMTFSYHDKKSNLQYCGNGINGIFAQRRNIINPYFLSMISEILRFYKIAKKDLNMENFGNESLGEYLNKHNFKKNFIIHHLIPMGSAIWSTPCNDMMYFPAYNFINFLNNHGLLSLKNRPLWKTVTGGSETYIRKMQKKWNNVKIVTNSNIQSIKSFSDHVKILHNNEILLFDEVIIATHANQVLALLDNPDSTDIDFFNSWKYAKSKVFLHTDNSVMPPIRNTWSSWNFKRINEIDTSLSYYMNSLQLLQTNSDYFVSLDLPYEPRNVIYEVNYEHPIFTNKVIQRRDKLISKNGNNRIWFTGSYLGNGFHEDAVKSSMDVVIKIGKNYE